MGFVGDFFEDIWGIVETMVDGVIDTVVNVVTGIIEAITTDYVFMIAAIAIGIYFAWPVITAAFSDAIWVYEASLALEMGQITAITNGLSCFIGTLTSSFSAMLATIHFDTIIAAHNIAMLVSEDYRRMMRKVYSQLSNVSEKLGFYPQFLALALRNARTLVQDVASTMGMNYDMSQIEWLTTLQDYLGKFNANVKRYKKSPELIFEDMADWIERPALDTKGAFMSRTLKTLEKTLQTVDVTLEDIIDIKTDLNRLAAQLPANIRSEIKPYISEVTGRFEDFIRGTYDPFKRELDGMLSLLTGEQSRLTQDVRGIASRISRPGDYLLEIYQMSPAETRDQEDKVAGVVGESYRRSVDAVTRDVEEAYHRMERIAEALEVKPEPLVRGVVEKPTVAYPPRAKIEERKTWYVGDY